MTVHAPARHRGLTDADHPETAAEILVRAARIAPHSVAIGSPDGSELTYQSLLDNASQLARALLAQGLEPGDRVATWMVDGVDYVEVYAACAVAGLVVVPINRRYTAHEARHLVEDSGARLLVHSQSTAPGAADVAATAKGLELLNVSDPEVRERLLRAQATTPLPIPEAQSPFILGYTSGTTGRPKGAVLTQGTVAAIARMNAHSYRLPVGSIAAMTGSMSFVAVVPAHIFSHFFVRGAVRFLGEWTTESLLAEIAGHGATFTYIPSPLLDEFAQAAARQPSHWQSLVTVLHSASKVAPETLARVADVIGGRLVEGWGMTENSGGLMTATTSEDTMPGHRRLETVGRPVPDVKVTVLDADGLPLPHDGRTVGELAFRSPALMCGYWNAPDATAAAIVDGWFKTGDLGLVDSDGYVTIVDRRVDLIVSGGMNVYPFEVEQVLMQHPDVEQACVVGVPHPRWGQSVAALVVVRGGAAVEADGLVAHCKHYLASYKKPRSCGSWTRCQPPPVSRSREAQPGDYLMSNEHPLVVERHQGVLTLRLDRPEARNAINRVMRTQLRDELRSAALDPDVRVIVLRGDERAFCAGGDTKEMGNGFADDNKKLLLAREIVTCIAGMPQPVVAVVRGHAAGAGFSLALACDLIVADVSALFTPAFLGRGLVPDMGASHSLPRQLGVHVAKDVLMTGRRLTAREAVAVGIVCRVWPADELERELSHFIDQLVATSATALTQTKRLVNNAWLADLGAAMDGEHMAQLLAMTARSGTPDPRS